MFKQFVEKQVASAFVYRVSYQSVNFKALFDFTWLRESKFGANGEKGKGPLMWSILLTRKK